MEKIKLIFVILCVIGAVKQTESTKLNYPRVLLPIFDNISINFTLEVIEKGCFKWMSSRQDLIRITPLYEDQDSECSSRAVVRVLSRERRRNTDIVLAEELVSGEVLRCDVILDVIDKLGVLTTSRELYLEEAPETFELWAQDSQGNAFTTLEGVEFSWSISPLGSKKDKNRLPALRFLTFTESKYHEIPRSLATFESLGIRGYMVLLEGINTGTEKVAVHLPYSEYAHVPVIEVYITVLANIILAPSDVHVMVGDSVNFRVLQLKQGKQQEISLNNQYYLELEDESCAKISGVTATGLQLGRTSVVLRDRNVPEENFNGDSNIPKTPVPRATLTVSTPHKMTINLLPHYNWVTVEGEKHEIAIDLYTSDDQKILLGPKASIESKFDESLFYAYTKTKNGSRIYGEAVKEGSGPVQGLFKGLSAKANLQIFKELSLFPQRVILPFDPNAPKTQKIQFRARGGDGSYVWSTQNPALVEITQTGLATTHFDADSRRLFEAYDETSKSVLLKSTVVKVALSRNTKIYRTSTVFFLPPVKLEIVKYNFETSLRDYVKLHLAVYAFVNGSYVPFKKCENLNFDFEFTNQIFQLDAGKEQNDELASSACHIIYLRSTSIGTTHLKVAYKFMDKTLRDEVTLNVFEKLNVLNPAENEIILPIGSTRNILYNHGPQRIYTIEADLTKSVELDTSIAEVSEIEFESTKSIYAFTVLCKKVGETTLTFNVYNALLTKNFDPYVSTFVTHVHCVKPRFINLYATEKLRQSCPMEMKNSLMHLKKRDDKFEIVIEVQDAKNRKLMNISSLIIDWEFAEGDGKYGKDAVNYVRHSEVEFIEGVKIPGKELLTTTIADVANNFKIKGVVSKYNEDVLYKHSIKAEVPNFGIQKSKTGNLIKPVIENEINFMAVNSTVFPFEHISIFLAKNRPMRIPVQQGSGFYEFQLSENGIVAIEFDSKARELIITPHKIGHVQLELLDRCLMTEPARLSVSVVTVGSIRADVPDRVEKSKSIEAIVKLYDSNDNLLKIDSRNLQIYKLREDILNPTILSVKQGDQSGLELGEIRYIVTGHELGETKVVFNSGAGEWTVASDPVSIQVFPPLRLYPRNSTLVIGSSVQIEYQGGPHPDVNIVYSVENENIATMDSALVQGKRIGSSKITGKCVGTNPATGKQIIFSEDTVEVHVVPLDKIQIRTPLVRIKLGAVMPATVWGVPDLSPMILGTLDGLRVIWSTNHPDVVDIYSVFSEAGIEYGDRDLITVRIKALNPGKAKVQATVILPNGQRLSSSVEVAVFKILELESPKRITMDSILIAPSTTIQLKANLDDVVYKLDTDASGIVKVTPDGIVRSSETLGRDLIIAKTFEQTLPIGIEVKNIQYILASLQYPLSVKLKQNEERIPRGMNFALKVSLHDNLGNEFSHNIDDVTGIKHDLSLKDMVDVQVGNNFTVLISVPRETNNMIAISLKDSTGVKYAEDYIKVSVAESKHIFPTKEQTIFTVGDIICFDSPLTLSSFWASSDERIVSIDKYTGVAKVLGNRFKSGEKIVVTNGDKSGSYLKYDLEVREADKIEFFKTYDIFSGTSYRGDLVIRNHLQIEKSTNLIGKNISKCSNLVHENVPVNKLFQCRITSKQQQLSAQLSEHYSVVPAFDKELGTYSCHIQLITSFNEVMNIVKTNDITFDLEAQLPNGLTDIITLKFVPGIKVAPDAISIEQITQQGIIITGLDKILQKVEVKPSDISVLEVMLQAKTHGSLQYRVKLLNELPSEEQLFILVHSPLTLQNIEIPIIAPNRLQQKCYNQPFNNNSSMFLIKVVSNVGLIISGLVVLGATIWAFVFCYPHRSRTDLNPEAFSTSLKSQSNIANISGSSALSESHSSPRGPVYPATSSSPYFVNKGAPDRSSSNLSSGNESPVYGDTSFIPPQRRINRRYL